MYRWIWILLENWSRYQKQAILIAFTQSQVSIQVICLVWICLISLLWFMAMTNNLKLKTLFPVLIRTTSPVVSQLQISNPVRICLIILPSSIVTPLNISNQVIRLVQICLLVLQLPIISQSNVLNQVICQVRICLIFLLWYIELTT